MREFDRPAALVLQKCDFSIVLPDFAAAYELEAYVFRVELD
jgi:hypothetical protein